ncbi:MAG: helix-turn-helix domain-containing protein [Ruminococcus sp.]|nr:helix-turn-helix domain-containing protein [Ruminococcus sp.]
MKLTIEGTETEISNAIAALSGSGITFAETSAVTELTDEEPEETIFQENLKRLRKQCNMSPVALAEESGVSLKNIYALEGGYVQPSDKQILKLCSALICPIATLFEPIRRSKSLERRKEKERNEHSET